MQWTGKAVVFKDFPKYVLTSCLDTMFFVAQDEALLADGGIKHLKYVLKLSNIVWRCHFKTDSNIMQHPLFHTHRWDVLPPMFPRPFATAIQLGERLEFLGLDGSKTDRHHHVACHILSSLNRKESRFMGNAAFL